MRSLRHFLRFCTPALLIAAFFSLATCRQGPPPPPDGHPPAAHRPAPQRPQVHQAPQHRPDQPRPPHTPGQASNAPRPDSRPDSGPGDPHKQPSYRTGR